MKNHLNKIAIGNWLTIVIKNSIATYPFRRGLWYELHFGGEFNLSSGKIQDLIHREISEI